MDKVLEFLAEEDCDRLDRFLAQAVAKAATQVGPELSRSRVKQLIDAGRVTVGGQPAKPSRAIKAGESVRVELPPPEPSTAQAEEMQLDVVYEDEWLIAVNKPRGMVVHPAPGHHSGTLVNGLLHVAVGLSGIGGVMRPGIVHRLDKDTSGLIIVAKDDATHRAMQKLFKERDLTKIYLAVVLGKMTGQGEIDLKIGRHPVDRKKMAVGQGRPAVTRWEAVEELKNATLLRVRILTGRTHQIRVHLAAEGHPVVGDELYGGTARAKGINDKLVRTRLMREEHQVLHALSLTFEHPHTGKELTLRAPVPKYLEDLVRDLGGKPVGERF